MEERKLSQFMWSLTEGVLGRSKLVTVKWEEYDGTYDCVICSNSVRGQESLRCTQCSSNPIHHACVAGSQFVFTCPQCFGNPFRAPPSEMYLAPVSCLEHGICTFMGAHAAPQQHSAGRNHCTATFPTLFKWKNGIYTSMVLTQRLSVT